MSKVEVGRAIFQEKLCGEGGGCCPTVTVVELTEAHHPPKRFVQINDDEGGVIVLTSTQFTVLMRVKGARALGALLA